MSEKHKRGDKHPTNGHIFWCYQKYKDKQHEYWVTIEQFDLLKSKEKLRFSSEKYIEKHKKRAKERYWSEKELESCRKKDYYQKNKDKVKKRTQEYEKNNKEKIRNRKKIYARKRREIPNLLLISRLRTRIRSALTRKQLSKNSSLFNVIGCDIEQLTMHFESLFSDGMNWSNIKLWHIDHIVPLATAKTEQEIMKLNHYKNLQPLWAIDNIKKGAKNEWQG